MKSRFIILCILTSFFLFFISLGHSENEVPQAKLLSYDYSDNTNFGIGYQKNTELEQSGIQNKQLNGKSEWIKLWLRIHIMTPQNEEWNHMEQYCHAIKVTNVKINNFPYEDICYCNELMPSSNAIPQNCSPEIIDDYYDNWEEYWERLFPQWSLSSPYSLTSYWSQSLQESETEWILELVVKNIGQDEKDIHEFVNSLDIQCKIDINYCGICTDEIQIINGSAQREVRFDENAVQFRADSFYEEQFEDVNDKTLYFTDTNNVLLCSNDVYLNDLLDVPEQYSLYALSITMLKQMPWAICNVEASIIPNETVIGIISESIDDVYDRDHWKNGFYTLYPIFLVVKNNNMDEQQLREKFKELDLFLTFSTEFEGINNFSGTESTGYPGVRFTMRVNMDELMTLDEAIEKLGDICDG